MFASNRAPSSPLVTPCPPLAASEAPCISSRLSALLLFTSLFHLSPPPPSVLLLYFSLLQGRSIERNRDPFFLLSGWKVKKEMEDDGVRRMSSRTRKVASKMVAALASTDNRTQAAIARLDALENDNAGFEVADANNDDDEASLDDEEGYMQKKQSKGSKRKTRQAKALEARKAPRTFLELIHEANLESLPPHVPSYLRAAVGPPSSTSRRYFCTVCGFSASYTCVRCGMRFCSYRCQNVHNDTRCLKFVA
ncbi:SWR1 complex subunit 6 [Stylosanthes scabra]|uniref:SWR1 complex subunit 6 n=2 Tax=Stylosanthes scabra TaxID=79078 RepID=A0ABU6SJ09_9FABA|nr:SWR1 complex subunit 6 [Stylosanthes scabra]